MKYIKIEKLKRFHVPEISEIEKDCFSTPWPIEAFYEECDRGFPHYVLMKSAVVIGYLFNIIYDTPGNYKVLHIANLAIHRMHRHNGWGSYLVKFAIGLARKNKCNFLVLEVRKSNTAAIHIYEKAGFIITSSKQNYYSEPLEDALVMVKPLQSSYFF